MSELRAAPFSTAVHNRVLTVPLHNPPVNGLSHALRVFLVEQLERAKVDSQIDAVVIFGTGRCFCAGADIRELGTLAAAAPPGLSALVHPAIERCTKPVIAAIHGIAMGGGLETALACNYRIACPDTRIATPEVKLGLLPLSGTQRLPRAIGLQAALELIVDGREIQARELRATTLIDQFVDQPADLVAAAVDFAHRVGAKTGPHPLIRDRPVADTDPEAIIRQWRDKLSASDGSSAQHAALDATAASFRQVDFEAGLSVARGLYDELYNSPAAARGRDDFLARRRAKASDPQ